jgi:hypothetical protein
MVLQIPFEDTNALAYYATWSKKVYSISASRYFKPILILRRILSTQLVFYIPL